MIAHVYIVLQKFNLPSQPSIGSEANWVMQTGWTANTAVAVGIATNDFMHFDD